MKKSILFITSLVAIATLPSCAGHKVTEQKVEKEIQAVNLNTQESTQEANRNFIMNSDKLTDDQKKMLVDLQVKTNAQMSETKNEIEKTRQVLIQTILEPKMNQREYSILKKKIVKLEKNRVEIGFKALNEARSIIAPKANAENREFFKTYMHKQIQVY